MPRVHVNSLTSKLLVCYQGVDTSKSMIDHFKSDVAKASLTNATAVVSTTEDGSELASDSADVAMVNCVLPHTSKPKAIIANLARAVRLGGHVTVAEMAATEHMTEHVEDGYEMSFCKPEEIHGWFKAAGIEVTVPCGNAMLGCQRHSFSSTPLQTSLSHTTGDWRAKTSDNYERQGCILPHGCPVYRRMQAEGNGSKH